MSKLKLLSLGGLMWFVLILGVAWQTKSCQKDRIGPMTLDEAEGILTDDGLHVIHRIHSAFTVSRKPLSEDEANLLSVASPAEKWRGVARVYADKFEPLEEEAPDHILLSRWGKVWVFGDPVLVKQITGRQER